MRNHGRWRWRVVRPGAVAAVAGVVAAVAVGRWWSSHEARNTSIGFARASQPGILAAPIEPRAAVRALSGPAEDSRSNDAPVGTASVNSAINVTPAVSVDCRLESPAYAHRPVNQIALIPAQGFGALAGTRVEIRARANVALGGGSLRIVADAALDAQTESQAASIESEPLTLDESDDRVVNGSFVLNHSGQITIQIMDCNGRAISPALAAPMEMLADAPPTVRILRPSADIYARAGDSIALDVSAEDDCGIARMQLQRSLNNQAATSTDYPIGTDAPPRVSMRACVALSQWRLSPGDTIRLRIAATDNNPIDPKTAFSQVLTIHIIGARSMAGPARTAILPLDSGSLARTILQLADEGR